MRGPSEPWYAGPHVVGCTVIARNHLAQASVLVDSFQAHHPGATFSALVIDAEAGVTVPYDPRLNLVTPSEAGVDPRELHRMAGIYSVLELACAMKPYAVRHALGRGQEPVVYVDSDVQVLAPLDEFAARAGEVGVVLTPHLERPPARDPHGVDVETVVLQSGVYNMGVFAAGPTAGDFLDWWAERLARECVVAPGSGPHGRPALGQPGAPLLRDGVLERSRHQPGVVERGGATRSTAGPTVSRASTGGRSGPSISAGTIPTVPTS